MWRFDARMGALFSRIQCALNQARLAAHHDRPASARQPEAAVFACCYSVFAIRPH